MATREKYDLGKIGDAILTGLDAMAKTPPPTKVRTGSKRAVLTQDRVLDRIRAMLDQGYAPSDIAEVCEAAGMPILGKTIAQYCRTPDGEPARAPTRRKRRSRRKTAAGKAATNPTASTVPETESVPDATTITSAQSSTEERPSTDPNDELRRLLAEGDEDSGGGAGRKKRRGNFIGED